MMDDKRRADIRERQLKQCNLYWYRAAVEALSGDTRALRNRVAMYDAPPMQVVLSDPE